MAIQINQNGTFSIQYEGPFSGLDVQNPETLVSDKGSPLFNNFMIRNAEIRSTPALIEPFPGPNLGDNSSAILGITSFLDINGMYHTVCWGKNLMFQFDPTALPGNPWDASAMVGAPGNMRTNTVSYRAFANEIWYTSIGIITGHQTPGGGGGGGPATNPFLAFWDGIAAAPTFTQTFSDTSTSQSVAGISLTDSPTVGGSLPGGPTIVGPIAIGGLFVSELNNYLILFNVTIKDQGTGTLYNFPNLIWWSANGLPLQWDPTQDTSAGFNPFLDVGDLITGVAMLGVAGYIFRTNGITEMTPTGSAITPWEFDHLWASERGIGNVYPWSIGQYGGQVAFIATDNIYLMTLETSNPFGGTARDAIFADLANAMATPMANIIPYFTKGYVYLTYELFIPMNGFVRQYVYSFGEQNWSVWDLPLTQVVGAITVNQLACPPNVV